MTFKDKEFVKLDFDIYANGALVQTTDEKKGKAAKLEIKEYGPQTIIVGQAFILKALDEALKKKDSDKLDLKPEDAYGKRRKDYLKTFPKSAFDEQQMRAVVGVTYDFNGMYGTVKSVVGGRVMVDFNNPLAGKDIKIEYKAIGKVTKIDEKISVILDAVLRLPKEAYDITVKEKNVTLKVPEQLVAMKDALEKSLGELIDDFKSYKLKLEAKK